MSGKLVVITGTGTGIGKTHFAEALLLAARRMGVTRAMGFKPVETGVGSGTSDASRLAAASTFHVKLFSYELAEPVSPHLAGRAVGVRFDLRRLAAEARRAAEAAELLVVELAGGLFSPLSDRASNLDLLRAIRPTLALLVAPDRLGVLHDVTATTVAARSRRVRLDGVVLVTPEVPDSSTGRNAAEIPLVAHIPHIVTLPRSPATTLAGLPALQALLTRRRSPRAPGSVPRPHPPAHRRTRRRG